MIDANILMSALIASFKNTFDLILNDRLNLFAPDFLLKEIEKHKEEILLKSGLEKTKFDLLLLIISSNMDFIPYEEFKQFIDQAKDMSLDPNDQEYFALALKLKCAIWTNDKEFKEQDLIQVYSTSELIEKLFK
ncbi:MAG: PIN domain-containing protein [Candidatus Woesearchaeota archaeon]